LVHVRNLTVAVFRMHSSLSRDWSRDHSDDIRRVMARKKSLEVGTMHSQGSL